MKAIIKRISKLLHQHKGIDILKYNESFLTKSIDRRMSENHYKSEEEYCDFLEQNKEEADSFIELLHNSYSEFFRNSLTFSVLEHIILPKLIHKKKDGKSKEIRIWSAACAQGQEVYSIAMLLEELRNGDKERVKYRLFATDKYDVQINKAQTGKYSKSDLNNVNLKRLEKWFTKQNDSYTIKSELMKNIDFSVFDLLDKNSTSPSASIFGDFDIVICANLLFYFEPKIRESMLDNVSRSISKGGYLITGEAEREILLNHNFTEVFPPSGIFQRKLNTNK